MPAQIALVHDWLTGMRGGEKCLESLAAAFPDAHLYTLLHRRGSVSPVIEDRPIHTSMLQRFPGVQRYYRYLLPLMPRAIEGLRLPADIQAVVSFSHAVAGRVHAPPGVPHICYCFSPMRYAWHMREAYFGQRRGLRRLNPAAVARDHLLDRIRAWDRAASDRVTHFVAISQTVADRIADCYGRSSTIIYPPVDTDFYEPDEVPRVPFYLVVSALVPYKRIDLAIEACRRLGRKLVVIGTGPEAKKLKRLARGANVRFLGWQSNDVIRQYLQCCRALLFPGCEDFGIVPLEAQACGAPVIAYGAGGATETVLPASEDTPGTGRFFAEQTPESLMAAMTWAEQHLDAFCPNKARAQAERFNKARFDAELLAFIQRVIASARVNSVPQIQPDVAAMRRAG